VDLLAWAIAGVVVMLAVAYGAATCVALCHPDASRRADARRVLGMTAAVICDLVGRRRRIRR
jgi:hypothetical protein